MVCYCTQYLPKQGDEYVCFSISDRIYSSPSMNTSDMCLDIHWLNESPCYEIVEYLGRYISNNAQWADIFRSRGWKFPIMHDYTSYSRQEELRTCENAAAELTTLTRVKHKLKEMCWLWGSSPWCAYEARSNAGGGLCGGAMSSNHNKYGQNGANQLSV